MTVERIKGRSLLFTQHIPEGWDLHMHLIKGDHYNYIIDTGLGSNSIEAVKQYIDNDKPMIVINTHYHWDHIWGNGALRGCLIVSHKFCPDMIEENWDYMMNRNMKYIDGTAQMNLPNLTFDRELYFSEDKIRLIHTPGHTADSISVLDEADRVMNAGDNIGDTMDEIIPNLDCEKDEYINTLSNYLLLDFDTCISGHNTIVEKQVIREMVRTLR